LLLKYPLLLLSV